MEIEKNHQESSTKCAEIALNFGQPPATVHIVEGGENQSQDDDSGSDSMTCPLFMEGLPRDFATNPQLAAIASLLDDDDDDKVREETKENTLQDDEEKKDDATRNNINNSNTLSNHKHRTPQTIFHKNSGKARNRRKKQRASPYSLDRTKEKQAAKKSASVGEITLFMNMWKP